MRKCWKRLLAMIGAGCLLLGAWTVPVMAAGQVTEQQALSHLDDELYLVDGFSSHLPVVVIEQEGTASLYAENQPLDAATLATGSAQKATYTEQWSPDATAGIPARDKTDYTLEFSGEALDSWTGALWDSTVQNGWFLLGGLYDKSLMRNYLALSLAAELDIAAYEVRYCEVFAATEGGYEYRGVYLLAASLPTGAQHIQRGGNYWDADSTPLDTYAIRQGMVAEGLYVPSLYSMDEESLNAMEQRLDRAERTIYSADYNEFSRYEDYLDMTKLYDYFILYELFGNYSAGHLPQYLYNAQTGKLWPVVLADFEYSLDNEQARPLDVYDIEMTHTPYYEPLTKSTHFVNGLMDRYRLLAQDILKSGSLSNRIDEAAALLGEAQLRDWQRWQDVYNGADMYSLDPLESEPGSALPNMNRNTYSYEQEINKLKFTLREHGNYMFEGMSELYQQDNMVGSDASYVLNTWLLVVFLVIVFASVRFVRYRTR